MASRAIDEIYFAIIEELLPGCFMARRNTIFWGKANRPDVRISKLEDSSEWFFGDPEYRRPDPPLMGGVILQRYTFADIVEMISQPKWRAKRNLPEAP